MSRRTVSTARCYILSPSRVTGEGERLSAIRESARIVWSMAVVQSGSLPAVHVSLLFAL